MLPFIDQRENNPKAVSEMGRQADVFRGASFVYAWLSAISIQQLNQIFGARTAFERLNRALRPMVLVLVDTPGSLLADRRCLHLKGCINRPGSASLEETPPESFTLNCFTLRTAIYFVNVLRMSEESGAVTRPWSESACQAYGQAVALGAKAGLYALSLRNAVGTFILAPKGRTGGRQDLRNPADL
jgi:hypothetical protein